jgi:hypothetical protein
MLRATHLSIMFQRNSTAACGGWGVGVRSRRSGPDDASTTAKRGAQRGPAGRGDRRATKSWRSSTPSRTRGWPSRRRHGGREVVPRSIRCKTMLPEGQWPPNRCTWPTASHSQLAKFSYGETPATRPVKIASIDSPSTNTCNPTWEASTSSLTGFPSGAPTVPTPTSLETHLESSQLQPANPSPSQIQYRTPDTFQQMPFLLSATWPETCLLPQGGVPPSA